MVKLSGSSIPSFIDDNPARGRCDCDELAAYRYVGRILTNPFNQRRSCIFLSKFPNRDHFLLMYNEVLSGRYSFADTGLGCVSASE